MAAPSTDLSKQSEVFRRLQPRPAADVDRLNDTRFNGHTGPE
jgi:hypothetical protein